MATNPMQRKARNSFLLGVLVTLLVSVIIIAFLALQLINMKKAEREIEASSIKAYALTRDVKSGEDITVDDFKLVTVQKQMAPKDPLLVEELGELNTAKIAMTAGTVVSKEMVNIDDDVTTADTRKQEYNMFILPMQLNTGDYVDIRLTLPSGQDYIVVAKKKVEIPQIAGVDSKDTIWIELNEDETLTVSNAIVEAYKIAGSKLYVSVYTDAGLQKAATPTYPVSKEVLDLINNNANIVQEAKQGLWARYNVDQRNNALHGALSAAAEDAQSNLEEKLEESITNSKTSRQEYLESLSEEMTAGTE